METVVQRRVIDTSKLLKAEKAMAPHSSTRAWKIPRAEEPAVHGVEKSRT